MLRISYLDLDSDENIEKYKNLPLISFGGINAYFDTQLSEAQYQSS